MSARMSRFDVSCKLGTVPKLVRLHGSDRVEVDRLVRIQQRPGARWESVLVTRINPDGFFFADLHTSFAPERGAQPPAGTYSYG